ncbi:hypothetical protein GCM10009795_023600 [Nocardioides hankookensis]|uniref:LuxR C-terminal-related transcriptional regulator n=1 Tax=Nocardioides hankookensis TaxID=443157 RepID=A0ABW1LG65_9ACTN
MSDAAQRAGVRRSPGRRAISKAAAQEVEDAAAALQVRRADLAARAAAGEQVGAEVVASGMGAILDWLADFSRQTRELVSTTPSVSSAQLRESLPLNRSVLRSGTRMTSLFDHEGTGYEEKVLLANEPVGTYLFGVAPVQMKIVDRRTLLIQGPVIDGDISLMKVTAPGCLDAAWHYWRTAMAHTIPFTPRSSSVDRLTARQRQVMALLAADLSDDAIASALGVSVRTVRGDVAGVLDALGVKSRFAAGVRLTIWDDEDDDTAAAP